MAQKAIVSIAGSVSQTPLMCDLLVRLNEPFRANRPGIYIGTAIVFHLNIGSAAIEHCGAG